MALSFCSNCAALDYLNPEMPPFHEHQSEVEEALLAFCDPFDPSHLLIDSLFGPPNDPFLTEANATPQHCSLSDPSLLSLPPDLYQPYDELDFYQSPKRPRRSGVLYHPSDLMFEGNSYNGAALGPAMSGGLRAPEFVTEFVLPPLPPVVGCNGSEKKADGGCLSAQSVAARERRKRISEKTQELGRLIPGGNKMNTAEMFHAASKYVKFLQAQIGILGMIGSIQGCKGSPHVEEQIQVLLESPAIQEKLYGDGRCMAPKEVVEALAEDKEIKSNLLVSRDLERFIKSMG